MRASRKKLITGAVLLGGIGVLVIAGISVYPSLRERYWIWKLESGTEVEQREAAAKLVDSRSVKAIPSLIEASAVAMMRPGYDWAVNPSD